MKKVFFILSLLFFGSLSLIGSASARSLCSNLYSTTVIQPETFEVNIMTATNTIMTIPAEILPDGSVWLHMDLSTFEDGEYDLEVKACNVWGCSSAVPFHFNKRVPNSLENIFIGK